MQRVCIARAVSLRPKILVLDEPTSSLDLSVRAGILTLLDELRRELDIALLFISHDLETLELIAHRVLVMYLGRVVEEGAAQRLFARPIHPYTQALLSASLPPDPTVPLGRHVLAGDPPSPLLLPDGCRSPRAAPWSAPTAAPARRRWPRWARISEPRACARRQLPAALRAVTV